MLLVVLLFSSLPPSASAQVTPADYERAAGLREKYEALALNAPGPATWVEKTHRFWYRRSVKGGNEFVLVDADTGQKRPPFDHEKLAATLAKSAGRKITAVTLPFNAFTFRNDEKAIEARFDGATWTCSLADYTCTKAATVGAFEQRQPPPACTPPAAGREAAGVARRQVGGLRHQLQRRDPRGWREAAHAAQHRRIGGELLRARLDGLGARLEEAGGVSRQTGLPPPRALCRVLARRPAAAEALDPLLRQARRRPRSRTAGRLSARGPEGAGHRQCPVPQSLRTLAIGVAQGQLGADLRVQPARSRGVPDHRGECRHGRGARRHLGRTEDVLHLLQQEVPARCRRRPRGRLDVGAGRLESPLSLRRRHWRREEPDHEGRLGGPGRVAGRR